MTRTKRGGSRRSTLVLPWGRQAGMLAALTLLASGPAAAQRTDVVIMVNGDRVTCEIVALERGILEAKTDSWGTLAIEWDDVASVTSARRFEVHLRSGVRHFGTLGSGPASGQVVIGDGADVALPLADLVYVKPVGRSLWSQLDGALDVGYSYASAGDSTQWSLSADISRSREGIEARLGADSFFSSKEGADDTSRHSLSADVVRYFTPRWGLILMGQGQRNDEIHLEFRGQGGAGVLHRLVRSNHTLLSAFGGVGYNHEVFTDQTDSTDSWEAVLGSQFERFVFNSPKTRISNYVAVLPSLTTRGRVRVELNSSVRRELLKDFFINVSLLESFDSQPPSEDARKNDVTLVTSVGWSF